ncbi:nitrous oxide reductase accessory protein NosL [Roseomonas sp. HJA6]|uniref:Nitrous oxide reductase accessory protein NosL n=1 Tax=Roseomonas alba TaxID=2846776 RepID=A0ABS7AHQ3_9PROT|nr:nitrous oxide reductase accessory protein NosL [Neoroseomonas alba]MBW6401848.1 nitrous oxide reductase accessory protein NosL [Neoroseomonas alba]
MKPLLPVLGLFAALLVGGCDNKESAANAPPPVALTAEAIGHYCGMALVEHPGPKGQILLRGSDRPVWFSSARDAIAFTMLAEEAKTLRAIYVSDMGRAETWDQPGATNWVEARRAHFVVGSDRRGGMGAEEAVPFGDRQVAERFATEHGGRVLAFTQIPRDWVLGGEDAPTPALSSPAASRHTH